MLTLFQYFEKVLRGTELEDKKVILQFLSGMVGKKFSFLNYYKEIPVSYDAVLLGIDNEMAEFSVHEYQAKVISFERKSLVYSHSQSPFKEDLVGEAFYVNSAKKRAILCNFSYALIRSDMRRYVRVQLDRPLQADLVFKEDILKGSVKDISLCGAALSIMSADKAVPGQHVDMLLRLPDSLNNTVDELAVRASILKIVGETSPFTCIFEIMPDKFAQQRIAQYINFRQVEIIRELKDINP